jgi:hypothetical protein
VLPVATGRKDTFPIACSINVRIVDTAEQLLRQTPIQNPGAVSGWIRRQNSMGVGVAHMIFAPCSACVHEMQVRMPDKDARNRPDILFLGLGDTPPMFVT